MSDNAVLTDIELETCLLQSLEASIRGGHRQDHAWLWGALDALHGIGPKAEHRFPDEPRQRAYLGGWCCYHGI